MTWPSVKLGEVCRIVSGSTPRTGVKEFWDGNIPWATPKDLSDLHSVYISETSLMITEVGYKSCSTDLLPPGAVLLSSRAPIGYVAINTVPMCTNQGFKSLIPDPKRLHSEYLYFWLRNNRAYLDSLGNGATFKELSKSSVERIPIALPPLEEQVRIADLLIRSEQLRDKHRKAIEMIELLMASIYSEHIASNDEMSMR